MKSRRRWRNFAVVVGVGTLGLAGARARACSPLDSIATSGALAAAMHQSAIDAACAVPCADPVTGAAPLSAAASRGGGTVDVSVVDFAFLPEDIVIQPNTTVRWTNNSQFFPHNAERSGTWTMPFLNPGQSGSFTFDGSLAGKIYDYLCGVHPFQMFGTVTVVRFGDANMDETVNLSDFNALASNFGTGSGATWEMGDFDGNGAVNLSDFNLLASNFGLPVTNAFARLDLAALSAAVPEPAGAGLVLIAAAAGWRRRRRP